MKERRSNFQNGIHNKYGDAHTTSHRRFFAARGTKTPLMDEAYSIKTPDKWNKERAPTRCNRATHKSFIRFHTALSLGMYMIIVLGCAAFHANASDDVFGNSRGTIGKSEEDESSEKNEPMYFDSRNSLKVVGEKNPTRPTPNITEEIAEDYYGDWSPAMADFFAKKFYTGPVCALVDARNTPENLKDLENCTIVNGFVHITFMHNTVESDFEKYTFPKLRVITEYLLIYRVYGLRSLRKMFPNLSVINGRQVFYNYGLVIYENPQLQEIGLENLRSIKRGAVRIQKNSKLCYVDTVDWHRLIPQADWSKVVISDNAISGDETCLDQCSEDGSCEDKQGEPEHCWGHNACQRPQCPSECENACENGKCICHEECYGGCMAPNNASECRACLHAYLNGTCVPECPDDTYLEYEWRCITRRECLENTWIPFSEFDPKQNKTTRKCIYNCPSGYQYEYDDVNEHQCKYCNKTCTKICNDEYVITDLKTLDELHGCTIIPNKLTIKHLIGEDAMSTLENNLGDLEEVGSLYIKHNAAITSLSFLKNLKRITGKTLIDNQYSIYIIDNFKLESLFPNTSHGLQIEKGKAFFHFNQKLCLKEIKKVSELTEEEEDDKDISITTNGDRGTCRSDMLPLEIVKIDTNFPAARIIWRKVQIDDERTLIGYQVFFKESKNKDAKRYEERNVCSKTDSDWEISDSLTQNRNRVVNESDDTIVATLLPLKPFTQYAVYVSTYTTSRTQRGAQSEIRYFTTDATRPTEPYDLTARAINSSAIRVMWNPPKYPNGNMKLYIVRWRKQNELDWQILQVDICKKDKSAPRTIPTQQSSPKVPVAQSKQGLDDIKQNEGCAERSNNLKDPEKLIEDAKKSISFEDFLIDDMLRSLRYLPLNDSSRQRRSINQTVNESSSEDSYDMLYDDYGNFEDFFGYDYDINKYNETLVNSTELIISGLHHFSEYEIQVLACNHLAVNDSVVNRNLCSEYSMTSVRTHFKLDVDVIPDSSLSVTTKEMKDERLQPTLVWDPPQDPNGVIKLYEIDISKEGEIEDPTALKHYYCYSVFHYTHNNKMYVIPTSLASGPHKARIRPVSLATKGNWTRYLTFDIPRNEVERIQIRTQNLQIGIAVGTVFIIIIVVIVIFGYKIKKRKAKDKRRLLYSSMNPEYVSIAAKYTPDEYEVPEDNVELSKVIGQGYFGKVYMGFVKNLVKNEDKTQVAIKKLHETSSLNLRVHFLQEVTVMKQFEAIHVVRLLGVVSQTSDPMAIMEYMAKGDLKSHLRSRRQDGETPSEYPPPNLQEKLQMAAEIADGMAYLSDVKCVHRDLAARNCLVSAKGIVKIGDFGLARDVYETDYYRKGSKGMLPIRWMAPESLRDGIFNSQTDVWSYGVVLWEIATLAEQPYQGRIHDEVTRYVIDGGYMERPKQCPNKLYDLMLSCWEYHPQMRPQFLEILTSLVNDVSERFKKESYCFEKMKKNKMNRILKLQSGNTDEEIALLSEEDSFRIVTPIDLTPSRSRSETPNGYYTPTRRHSDGSGKTGSSDFLAHYDHLKRVDASDGNTGIPNGNAGGVNGSIRANGILRKGSNSTSRSEKKPSPLLNNPSPNASRKPGENVYYSMTPDAKSTDTVPRVSAGGFPSHPSYSNIEPGKYAQTSKNASKTFLHPMDRIDPKNQNDIDKPYAHMNGLSTRNDSQSRRLKPFRSSTKRNTSADDESSYVESSPLHSAKYSESIEMLEGAPPPPAVNPPPLPANVCH